MRNGDVSQLLEACPDFDAISGWLSLEEAEYLFLSAARVSRGVIVEVGSANGRSTIALSMGARAGFVNAVYAIEPHEAFEGVYGGRFGPDNRRLFFETMLKFRGWENTRLVNISSEVICPGWRLPVGLLWIDGDHRYEAVRRDFDAWRPHLVRNSIVAFDDANDPNVGPHRVISECIESGEFMHAASIGKITSITSKAPDAG
jgi:hypothetical protein